MEINKIKTIDRSVILECINGIVIIDKLIYHNITKGVFYDNRFNCNATCIHEQDNFKVYVITKGYDYIIKIEKYKNTKEWSKFRYVNVLYSDILKHNLNNKIISVELWQSNIKPMTKDEYMYYNHIEDD